MERVGTLIDKLKEQFVQDSGADNMLLTVQMLFSELQQKAALSGWLFQMEETVTEKAQVKEMFELNDIHADQGLAINEQLKTENQELASSFQDKPIVDLKKAIGINDRYLFINELFRGDETMYERSLKTINSFAILTEAHYWIQRELKVKLGWNERSEIVGHFDQLVKRRFA